MNSLRPTTATLFIVAALVVSACARTSEGEPVADSVATVSSATSSAPSSTAAAPSSTAAGGQLEYGVVPTTRAPVPVDAVTCSPPAKPAVGTLAQVADPRAPRITVALPEGWGVSAGSGDVGAQMTGPGGASATVTIATTQLDAGAAFRAYTDDITAQAAISAVSILPAELCSYSGQKLMGTLADEPGEGIQFTDHVVHVWTNADDYLVAVHVQTPMGAVPDDAAIALLTDDFEIRIP